MFGPEFDLFVSSSLYIKILQGDSSKLKITMDILYEV